MAGDARSPTGQADVVLHHVPWGRSFRVLWLLAEMGITPQIIRYDIGSRKMREPGLMAHSPAGRIPALQIDGHTIFESAAILQYLCEARPEHGFGRPPGDAMFGFNLFAAPYYVRLDPWPGLQGYWARLQKRPGFKAAAAIEGPQAFYARDFYEVPVDA